MILGNCCLNELDYRTVSVILCTFKKKKKKIGLILQTLGNGCDRLFKLFCSGGPSTSTMSVI